MRNTKRLVFMLGGPEFHPVEAQSRLIEGWLGAGYACVRAEGRAAFERLDGCDLLVLMGLHWTGMKERYVPMTAQDLAAFEAYVASGRPLLLHHGSIASFDDTPRFGELTGYRWVWGVTKHSPIGEHAIEVLPTRHALIEGVEAFRMRDELYYDVEVTPMLRPQIHAQAEWQGRRLPMVMSAQGARVAGAGKIVYLANGHDLASFECPALKRLWVNAVRWLLNEHGKGA